MNTLQIRHCQTRAGLRSTRLRPTLEFRPWVPRLSIPALPVPCGNHDTTRPLRDHPCPNTTSFQSMVLRFQVHSNSASHKPALPIILDDHTPTHHDHPIRQHRLQSRTPPFPSALDLRHHLPLPRSGNRPTSSLHCPPTASSPPRHRRRHHPDRDLERPSRRPPHRPRTARPQRRLERMAGVLEHPPAAPRAPVEYGADGWGAGTGRAEGVLE